MQDCVTAWSVDLQRATRTLPNIHMAVGKMHKWFTAEQQAMIQQAVRDLQVALDQLSPLWSRERADDGDGDKVLPSLNKAL